MTTIETLRSLTILFDDDGAIRSTKASYDEIHKDGEGGFIARTAKGTKRLDKAALTKALPDGAALMAQIDELISEKTRLSRDHEILQDRFAEQQNALRSP